MVNEDTNIKLQPPGAGLPLPELYIAKFRFWLYRRQHAADQFRRKFEEEQKLILELVEQLSAISGATPVLIRRLRGMEDSSRNWSVFMTLEHLSIVNGGVAKSIKSLLRGEVPAGNIGTADVKPDPASDEGSVETFRRVCSVFLKSVGKAENMKSNAKYQHPWFGPLDAFSWLALAAFHMRLHRRQIELIVAKVRTE